MTVYVVKNINGDIIGVADSPDEAVWIYEKRYGEVDYMQYDTYDGGYYQSAFHCLFSKEVIEEFELNQFYYA